MSRVAFDGISPLRGRSKLDRPLPVLQRPQHATLVANNTSPQQNDTQTGRQPSSVVMTSAIAGVRTSTAAKPAPVHVDLSVRSEKQHFKNNKGHHLRRAWSQAGRIVAIVVMTGALFMAYDTWHVNQGVKEATSDAIVASQGIARYDETPPPANALASYAVPHDQPRALTIPSIGVSSRVLKLGVDRYSAMDVPTSIYDVGWYEGSAHPGSGGGAVVMNGHVSGPTKPGVFAQMKQVKQGDEIIVERGDKQTITYIVDSTKTVEATKVDMAELLTSQQAGKETLNLITCGGSFNKSTNQYESRVIVFAIRK